MPARGSSGARLPSSSVPQATCETLLAQDAAAIRAAYDEAGELSAAAELRRRFPGITVDNTEARTWAGTIAGWKPLPLKLKPQRRPSKDA
jgi:hypothetical protein